MLSILISVILVIIGFIIYRKRRPTSICQHDQAIILGGSISGIITASYLTKYFKKITIIESDDIFNDRLMTCTSDELLTYRCQLESPTSLGCSGVSQIYQTHVMESEEHEILKELFPDLDENLYNEYNICNYSLKTQAQIHVNGNRLNHHLTEDIQSLGSDRFTLELMLRKQLNFKYKKQIQEFDN